MNKILTIVIPSYNTERDMENKLTTFFDSWKNFKGKVDIGKI